MATIDHDFLVSRARTYLSNDLSCGVVFTELVAATYPGETPDAIGWKNDYSILIECKTSRSDFFADQKKIFRRSPEQGMGAVRIYMTTPDLISVEELPDGWGLVETDARRRVNEVHVPKGNIWGPERIPDFWWEERHLENERTMMLSALRRLDLSELQV